MLTCTPVAWHYSSTSCAVKDAAAAPPGTSGQQEDFLGSASSSLTDLPVDEECSGTSRLPPADSEEDGFSYNEDDTESQEVGCCLCFAFILSLIHSFVHSFIHALFCPFIRPFVRSFIILSFIHHSFIILSFFLSFIDSLILH